MNNPLTPPAQVETIDINESIVALQGIISVNAARLKEINENKKIISEQIKSVIDNDPEYNELVSKADPYIQSVKEKKAEIKASGASVELQIKKKDLAEEAKEIKESLSNHLMSYRELTGSNVLDSTTGEQIEFRTKAFIKPDQLRLF